MYSYLLKFLAAPCTGGSFFGLTPWYQYLEGEPDSLGKCVPVMNGIGDIWLVALAVVDSLLKIAGVVAVGFVIYGGIQFMISQGEPENTKKARETILNAVIGVIIAIVASASVSYIGNTIK